MTRADRLIIAVLAALALVAWPLASAVAGAEGGSAVINGPGGQTTVPLSSDADYHIAGAVSEVIVRVSGGSVCVVDSGCPGQTCVHTGGISAAGEVIACVPNRVVVRIGGERADEFDARIR